MIYFQANALRPWPLPTPPTPTTSRCQRPPSAPSWQSPACSWPQTPFQRVGNGAISASLAACCEDRMIWPEFSPASATTTTFQKLNIETMMLLFIHNLVSVFSVSSTGCGHFNCIENKTTEATEPWACGLLKNEAAGLFKMDLTWSWRKEAATRDSD